MTAIIYQDINDYLGIKSYLHEKDVADKGKFLRHERSPTMYRPIPRNTFHQIVGRAGRAGFDDTATAYILVHSKVEGWQK